MNTKSERLKAIARELHEMFPGMNQVELVRNAKGAQQERLAA